MSKLSKKRKAVLDGLDTAVSYSLQEATDIVKKTAPENFDASVDMAIRLGVDPKQANQMVRGVVTLPHGTGKDLKVLALVTPDKEAEANEAGANFVGLDEYIEKIKGGWVDIDVIITMPSVMGKIGALGRVLGPRGLMPNPKSGTVTTDVVKAVNEVKAGRIEFRVDKYGLIHTGIGKLSFDKDKLVDNVKTFMGALLRAKPPASKGTYLKKISITSTMGPGLKLDKSEFTA